MPFPAPPLAARKLGQQSTFTATFRNDDGQVVDPATVTFRWRVELSTPTQVDYVYGVAPQVQRIAVGIYTFRAPPYAAAALHTCRVESTGVFAADEGTITVAASVFSVVP